jgi:thioredoxin 1
MIRDRRKRREDARHVTILEAGRETAVPPFRLQNRRTSVGRQKASIMEAVTEGTFEQEVLQSETPVLVDFWAEWCGPCHAVAPVLERIAEEREGELKLVKVNIDEEQELAVRYGVMSIPTMMLFRNGEPAAAVAGAQPKGAIERALGLEQVAA